MDDYSSKQTIANCDYLRNRDIIDDLKNYTKIKREGFRKFCPKLGAAAIVLATAFTTKSPVLTLVSFVAGYIFSEYKQREYVNKQKERGDKLIQKYDNNPYEFVQRSDFKDLIKNELVSRRVYKPVLGNAKRKQIETTQDAALNNLLSRIEGGAPQQLQKKSIYEVYSKVCCLIGSEQNKGTEEVIEHFLCENLTNDNCLAMENFLSAISYEFGDGVLEKKVKEFKRIQELTKDDPNEIAKKNALDSLFLRITDCASQQLQDKLVIEIYDRVNRLIDDRGIENFLCNKITKDNFRAISENFVEMLNYEHRFNNDKYKFKILENKLEEFKQTSNLL